MKWYYFQAYNWSSAAIFRFLVVGLKGLFPACNFGIFQCLFGFHVWTEDGTTKKAHFLLVQGALRRFVPFQNFPAKLSRGSVLVGRRILKNKVSAGIPEVGNLVNILKMLRKRFAGVYVCITITWM